MAPNKKKKKPASNPARGFATTSIASKSKIDDSAAVGDVTMPVSDGDLPISLGSVGPVKVLVPEKELHELTPDQLELRLVESELQLLVEQHGEKSKKDASRCVSRLQTERRLLRLHALSLHTSRWLPEELLLLIRSYIETEGAFYPPPIPSSTMKNGNQFSFDDLSIRLWTLQNSLLDLGFLRDRVHDALAYLIGNDQMIELAKPTQSKEGIWGIDECLDWLALSCTREEMPDYDSHRTEAIEKSLQQSYEASPILDSSTPALTPPSSGVATPNAAARTHEDGLPTVPERSDHSSRSAVGDESDDDLEPQELLGRYLDLKTRLYERRPDLTLAKFRVTKGARTKSNRGGEHIEDRDPTTRKLLSRLKKFERDILFDIEEAEEKWTAKRIDLVKEAANRKKFGIAVNTGELSHLVETVGNQHPELSISAGNLSSENEDDTAVEIGDLFAALPEYAADNGARSTGMSINTPDGSLIAIRDFGKWPGVGPRRIFEEACRARDSSSKVSYGLVSASSFSYRHSVSVRWSRMQHIPSVSSVLGVSCQSNNRNITIQMMEVSCPDSTQSEAYVSTVSLFVIFSGSPKEEKAHLRLPAAWKDLWDELAVERKEQIAASDREELRSLRKLIEEVETRDGSRDDVVITKDREIADVRSRDETKGSLRNRVEDIDPQALKGLWTNKSSSRAYTDMLKSRMSLPIWEFKVELLSAIETHQVIIICGETGCGKSTQVPAYILETELSHGRQCKVYCTEPRRISAITLAQRVSAELGEQKNDMGSARSLVGYAIRLESQITPDTRLIYVTTGIVMRMLEGGNDLQGITHLVLDEVHERTIDSDFLLIVLRKLMLRRPELKVILMSATVNAEQFSKYLDGAPILNVPGRTFPVLTKYLEDAIEVTNYGKRNGGAVDTNEEEEDDDTVDRTSHSISNVDLIGYSPSTVHTLSQFNEYRIDYELITKLLETISRSSMYTDYSKAILIFLPGIVEIKRMNDMLVSHPSFSHGWYIYPLHSTIATDEQEKAFLVPPNGIRKIVLATNIAETGITIPDVTCVIDTGKHKEMRFDERRQLSRLIESFISRANAKQRRGRAGRVQNGLCFHLFTKVRHDTFMADQQMPEMLRLSLQDLVLRIKICKLGSIEQTLAEALDPPVPKNIRRAIDSLIDVKALTMAEDLTPLGRQLAKLPLDVFLGKLILLGSLFKCLDAALTIAAIISSKSPFSAPMGARAQADLARLAYKKADSDLLTVYNAYCAWRRVCQEKGSSEYQFCRKNFLSPQVLSNIEDLKVQLTTFLVDAGFLRLDESGSAALNKARFYSRQRSFVELPPAYETNVSNELIVNSVIAWSFYPKLLMRDGKGWRNVANNQAVSLYPTSVNKGVSNPPEWLSFYHIMQSSSRSYNAHETSAVEDFAIALVCGDAEFKMYAGVIIIDSNRLRFSVSDWKTMLVLKRFRVHIREIMSQFYKNPGKPLTQQQQAWFDIWQTMFSQEWLLNKS